MIDEEDGGDVAIRFVSMIASSLSRRVHDHEWQETAVDMVIVPAVCVTYCQEKYNGDRQRGRERTSARIYTGSSLRNGEPNFMTVWSCSWWPYADVDLFHWAKNTIIFYSLLPYIIHTVDTHRHTYKRTHTHLLNTLASAVQRHPYTNNASFLVTCVPVCVCVYEPSGEDWIIIIIAMHAHAYTLFGRERARALQLQCWPCTSDRDRAT